MALKITAEFLGLVFQHYKSFLMWMEGLFIAITASPSPKDFYFILHKPCHTGRTGSICPTNIMEFNFF